MDNRIKRGVIVVVFTLLVYAVGSMTAAYAAPTPTVVQLNVWNNTASSGRVLVTISPSITATSGTITVSFADPVDARATIDKFFWSGTAVLTYKPVQASTVQSRRPVGLKPLGLVSMQMDSSLSLTT